MKHYVVICDTAFESGENYKDVTEFVEVSGIAHSLKKAKEILAKAVIGEKQYADEHGWIIHHDTDEEFMAGECGNYAREHAHFFIKEVDSDTDNVVPSEILDKIDRIEESTLDYYRNSITRERYVSDVKAIRKTVSDYVSRTEPSNTDFVLVKKLADVFEPSTRGIITAEEKELVANTLELNCRNVRELRNLRNTFVMVADMSTKNIDYISAVTYVIDEAIINRGGEV